MPTPANRTTSGFTLVELSVVLVIVALIAGAMFVGSELVTRAQIRATIHQQEQYLSATRAFQAKYGGLPGDLQAREANEFGFRTGDGTFAAGNGDGLISNGCPEDNFFNRYMQLSREGFGFWVQLAQAQMSDFKPVSNNWDHPCNLVIVFGLTTSQNMFPAAQLNDALRWAVYEDGTTNFLLLSSFVTNLYMKHIIPPIVAQEIDAKIDDGMAASGFVIAMTSHDTLTAPPAPAAPNVGVCIVDPSLNSGFPDPVPVLVYNTAKSDYANAPACSLRFRMQ